MKRIIISVLACACLNGCGAVIWGQGYVKPGSSSKPAKVEQVNQTETVSNATAAESEEVETAPAAAPASTDTTEGVVLDPAGGHWAFKVEKVLSGEYATRSMVYVNADGKEVPAMNKDGERVEIFATTGFVNGLAMVASCSKVGTDGFCNDWRYGILRPDGTFAMEMQENYTLPSYVLLHTYPAVIAKVSDGKRLTFPMWADIVDIEAEGVAGELYSNDRILVSSRSDAHFGYINGRGMLMLNTQYTGASEFVEGKATVLTEERGFSIIDTAGVSVEALYSCAFVHEENSKYIRVNQGGECLNPALDARYTSLAQRMYFIPGYFTMLTQNAGEPMALCLGGQTGIVLSSDMQHVVVPAEYDFDRVIYVPELDVFMASKDRQTVIYGNKGQVLSDEPALTSFGTVCGYDVYLVKLRDGKMGAVKGNGEVLLETKYDEIAYDQRAQKLAALLNGNVTMHDLSALKLGADQQNLACGAGLRMVSVRMPDKSSKLSKAHEVATQTKATWVTQRDQALNAHARKRAALDHAGKQVVNMRSRVSQEIQSNLTEAEVAQSMAAVLQNLEERKTEIQTEIAQINQDPQKKFTLDAQNRLRALKQELVEVEQKIATVQGSNK